MHPPTNSPNVIARSAPPARAGFDAPVWLLVSATAAVWGGGGLASKALLESGLDPFTVSGAPFLAGAIAAWIIGIWRRRIAWRPVMAGASLGVVNLAIPTMFFTFGYETLPAGLVTLLLTIGPVVTAATAHFTLSDERFNLRKGIGLVLAIAGVAVLGGSPAAATSPSGVAWVVAGAIIAGATGVMSRVFAVRHGAGSLVAAQLTAGGVTPLIIGLVLGRTLTSIDSIAPIQWWGLLGVGLIASYGGFRMIMRANEVGTTGQVSVVAYLVPVVGVVGGIVLFGESISPALAVGAALILGGVAAVSRASGKPARVVRAAG